MHWCIDLSTCGNICGSTFYLGLYLINTLSICGNICGFRLYFNNTKVTNGRDFTNISCKLMGGGSTISLDFKKLNGAEDSGWK
jgi:hypothetical protein